MLLQSLTKILTQPDQNLAKNEPLKNDPILIEVTLSIFKN